MSRRRGSSTPSFAPSRRETRTAARASRHRPPLFASFVVALLVVVAACSRKPAEQPAPSVSSAPAPSFHGGPAAHPNDWCGGHGVPESECTRCNPELIPRFQARHDWCAEHGVPESQCTVCHPELLRQGVAPPPPRAGTPSADRRDGQRGGDVAGEGARVATGATVRFASPDVAAQVGIETTPAQSRALEDDLTVPVRLAFDPSRVSRVSARVPGVVRAIDVMIGATVRPGDTLATLDSAAAASTRAELASAQTRVRAAQNAADRARVLQGEGVGGRAEVERAEAELAAARATLSALTAAGALVGAGSGRAVRVVAPRAGVVVARSVSVGQQVGGEEVLIELADLSSLWAILDVPDIEAPRLRVGQPVRIEIPGFAEAFSARLGFLSPTVDPHTRTVEARVELPNADGRLRANAFGQARIQLATSGAGVVVPRDALQRVERDDIVFVARSPAVYEARVVQVALRTPREVQLLDGVRPGERVVTVGGFELKTELLRDSIGAGCCDGEG